MFQKFRSWFKTLSTVGKIGIIAGTSFTALAATSAAVHPSSLSTQTAAVHKTAAPTCSAAVSYRTETQTIAFISTTTEDAALAKGQTKVTTTGVNGEKQLRHEVTTYSPAGCKTNNDAIVSESTTKQPINQVTAIGTFVAPAPQPSCPNGSYVNSAGNTVCNPYASSTTPSGATARCRDGTYSFSQSHSGTCSHHGGVADWL